MNLRSHFKNISFVIPEIKKLSPKIPGKKKPSMEAMLEDKTRDIKMRGRLRKKRKAAGTPEY